MRPGRNALLNCMGLRCEGDASPEEKSKLCRFSCQLECVAIDSWPRLEHVLPKV